MVAQALTGRGVRTAVTVAAALGYLVAMVVAGALPEQRQLVKFEANGVMKLEPERITRVELRRGKQSTVLLRAAGRGTELV